MLQDPTKIFDVNSPAIQELVKEQNWLKLLEKNRIIRILNFVKNDIVFGFSKKPLLAASQILAEGRGYALTKSILLKTLLDASGVLCRFHAFKISKNIYKGLVPPLRFSMLPDHLLSVWIEVLHESRWLVADGVILDEPFLENLKKDIQKTRTEYKGFGCAVFLDTPLKTVWDGNNHTYCQRAAITRDLGVIEEFDWFFTEFKKDIKQLGKISPKFANRVIHKRRFGK